MTAQGQASKSLDEAFCAAFLLTGSTPVAEKAVMDGIAALEDGHVADDDLLIETVRSAILRRDALSGQSAQADLAVELRRLFLVVPISRDYCVLRVLPGKRPAACPAVLRITIQETEHVKL
jgi:hypothetical protein